MRKRTFDGLVLEWLFKVEKRSNHISKVTIYDIQALKRILAKHGKLKKERNGVNLKGDDE